MANQKHIHIIKKGKEFWNNWRKENPEIKPDLSGADLREFSYSGVDFRGANLEKANFNNVFMVNADFSFANLHNADLTKAFLIGANFHGANLEKANLSFTALSYADFEKSKLMFAKLDNALLEKANLNFADLRDSSLISANLRGASLIKADLSRADLTYANLEEADLSSANISEADLRNAIFSKEVENVDKNNQLIENIKRHVVQVEVMILVVVLFLALLSIQQPLQTLVDPDILYLFPFAFLALIPMFIRVTNPESSLRSRLTFGISGAGFGATIGGGITGTLTGGLGAPAGALIGAPIGFIVGAIAGPYIDGVNKKVLTQGEARELLIKMQGKYPHLTLEKIVEATSTPYLRNKCAIYMFHVDGVIKCTKDDVFKWLESECWK